MASLIDSVAVAGRFARSASLERDAARTEPLDGYIVTARALDVVERIATAAASGPAGGAWSLTGPYGSGKSSLALLIDAALSGATETGNIALRLIGNASPSAGELVRQAHRCHGTEESGFYRGLATAAREPLSHTVLRALHNAVVGRYGKIPPKTRFAAASALRGALKDAASSDPRRRGPSPATLIDIARCLAAESPLLLIIDEFGKNLEAFRDSTDADPYLLQQLAEAGQSSAGLPIFVLTLQHLSFEDYLGDTDGPQRLEWAKVQGRFEDIPYVESATQTRALIRTVFKVNDKRLQNRINGWARRHADAMRTLGVSDLADPDTVASCYPLHPLAALVLPELCSRYGQHERTLFSFLAGPDRSSAASFLESNDLAANDPLPSVGLESVYDYFVTSGAPGAQQSSRWTEVAVRLRDAHGLSARQERLAKTIALLNLVSTAGTVRASRAVLELVDGNAEETLSELESTGIVTYRDFADEYRIWHGTDVDVRRLLETARRRVQRRPLVEILSGIDEPSPVVAARHSAEHHVLRVFKRRYASGGELVEPIDPFSPYDGELLLVADSDRTLPDLTHPSAGLTKPVVAAIPEDVAALDTAAREAAAVALALDDPAIADDWVARREMGERQAQARAQLDKAIAETFGYGNCRWVLLEDDGLVPLTGGRGSAALSKAADRAYPHTPTIPNEMLNRTALTSQGAKARRTLIEAMIEHGGDPDLSISGYGPEMAMYRAFLKSTGLHGRDDRNDTMVFRSPAAESMLPAWELLVAEFKRAKSRRINLSDIYAVLLSPPIGMKQAAIPVFLTAGLLAYADEIAIYEHGTFKPLLTPELSERMVRNPAHFDIKHFANTAGARRLVINELADRLGVRPRFRKHRVANVLAIVGHLVSRINGLDNYTRRTANLTPPTLAAREALLAAVEPDDLLFTALPGALGFPSIPIDAARYPDAKRYARAVDKALSELTSAYGQLLERLLRLLLSESVESSRLAVTGQAAALVDEVLNPSVRAFVLTLANDGVDSDADWIKAVATVVAQKAPAEWSDEYLRRFEQDELPQQVAAFRRLMALHSERRVDGGGPFDAYRVIFTRSDGSEEARLVSLDRNERPRLDAAFQEFVGQLEEVTGSPERAHHALLALMGERLIPSRVSDEAPAGTDMGIIEANDG